MPAKTPDLFPGTKPKRNPPQVKAHVCDAGVGCILFSCKCGWDSGWLDWDGKVTEAKRGIPCEACNNTRKCND